MYDAIRACLQAPELEFRGSGTSPWGLGALVFRIRKLFGLRGSFYKLLDFGAGASGMESGCKAH